MCKKAIIIGAGLAGLTAMAAVDNIGVEIKSRKNSWVINTGQEYHEQKEKANEHKMAPESNHKNYTNLPFKKYIFKDSWNRNYLVFGIIAILIQWIVFKVIYPYASFISDDSYFYIDAAMRNLPVNIYPIGYSMFLRIFSVFSISDTALVSFQYLFLQGCNLFLFFTGCYFYSPGKLVHLLLYAFIVINPVFLYLANYVSSDALFLSLSILWFTLLLWIIHKPTTGIVIIQCLVLFIAFTVRYNALIYPAIAAFALLLSKQRLGLKLAGIGGSVLLIGLFVWNTSNHYLRFTGARQFSPFTGWQLANNALYGYKYVDSSKRKPVPPRFQTLDNMVRTYFDSTRDYSKHPDEALIASTVYMWDSLTPLRQYMKIKTQQDTDAGPITRWATVAPELADYGSFLIRQYPLEFAKFYLLPNTLRYFVPPVEYLPVHNPGDSVASIAQFWFGYKSMKVTNRLHTNGVTILNWFPILTFIINLFFLFICVGYLPFKGWKKANDRLNKTILFIAFIWALNFAFSVFASPIALRFQLFPIMVLFMFTTILFEFIHKIDSYARKKLVPPSP